MPARTRVFFYLTPEVHLLDLSGPAQVFLEATAAGVSYELGFCSDAPKTISSAGLILQTPCPFQEVSLNSGDLLILPGMSSRYFLEQGYRELPAGLGAWLRELHGRGVVLCSICSGAFLLGEAGLLNGRKCTTHWRFLDQLQDRYPRAQVQRNRLFSHDRNIYTSAGVTSGIDLALFLLEERHGPRFATRIARELVVYLRRDPVAGQDSIYLEYRNHLHPGVHEVQDWLVHHLDQHFTIDDLAEIAHLSGRHLTRSFKRVTGITINEYVTQLRLERARSLLQNHSLTIDEVAARCGFRDPAQLRRRWKERHDCTPSQSRQSHYR